MKKNWLSENISAIIALSFIGFTFFVFRMILLRQVAASETIVVGIVGSVTNITMLIVGYYFGSSDGSKKKQQTIDEIKNPTKEPG